MVAIPMAQFFNLAPLERQLSEAKLPLWQMLLRSTARREGPAEQRRMAIPVVLSRSFRLRIDPPASPFNMATSLIVGASREPPADSRKITVAFSTALCRLQSAR
jgi:hypothetical protein